MTTLERSYLRSDTSANVAGGGRGFNLRAQEEECSE